jgi:methylamine dehydrogenase accessory protein MauD
VAALAFTNYEGSSGVLSGWWAASYAVLWVLVLMLCVIVVALARQIGTLHLRVGPLGALEIDDEGPPLGEAPAPLDARTVDGSPLTVGGPGEAQLLVFVSPGCRVCREVLPAVPAVAAAHGLSPVIVAGEHLGDRDASYPPGAAVVASAEVMSSYAVPGTPYVVVLDRSGVARAKGTVNNLEQLEGLVDTARRRQADGAGHRVG